MRGKVRAHAVVDRWHCNQVITEYWRLRRQYVNVHKNALLFHAYVFILSLSVVTCTRFTVTKLPQLSAKTETNKLQMQLKVAQMSASARGKKLWGCKIADREADNTCQIT